VFPQTSLFLRLWASRLRLKPKRLPAVKFLQANPYDIDLVVSSGIPSSSASSIAWRMLIYAEFLRLWDTCIIMVVAWASLWTLDITGYVFLALRISSFCYTRSYLSQLAGVVKKWTLGAWATTYPVEIEGF